MRQASTTAPAGNNNNNNGTSVHPLSNTAADAVLRHRQSIGEDKALGVGLRKSQPIGQNILEQQLQQQQQQHHQQHHQQQQQQQQHFHHHKCGHDTRNKLGTRLINSKNAPFKGLLKKMGNKLSCSCGPLKIKGYRFDANAEPWAQHPAVNNQVSARAGSRRAEGQLLRLWAEVFHVTTSSSGSVKWSQVSEDLVPVNITCVPQPANIAQTQAGLGGQDGQTTGNGQGPTQQQVVFHVTAYNSQVEKILDVRLIQPGTRIGQASECFVYWKDPATNDTWGLNFTSPIDAKQFRECCDAARVQSRLNRSNIKPSSRSTPASPSRSRGGGLSGGEEPRCTCMTADQYSSRRSNDPRLRAATPCGASGNASHHHHHAHGSSHHHARRSQTLPRNLSGSRDDVSDASRVSGAHSSSSVYDNVKRNESRMAGQSDGYGSVREGDRTRLSQRDISRSADQSGRGTPRSHGGDPARNRRGRNELLNSKSVDYHDGRGGSGGHRASISMGSTQHQRADHVRRLRSKSTDQLHHPDDARNNANGFDSGTLKRMLKPVQTAPESPVTSPEGGRRSKAANMGMSGQKQPDDYPVPVGQQRYDSDREGGFMSEPESAGMRARRSPGDQASAATNATYRDIGRPSTGNNQFYKSRGAGPRNPNRPLYLDFNEQGAPIQPHPQPHVGSPPSDSGGIFDSHCFATTPSSSNGNSDLEGTDANRTSPTSQLLMDYEEHLRNTLEKGMDAESYSLHTFEALLTRSMENLEAILYHGRQPLWAHRISLVDTPSVFHLRRCSPPSRPPARRAISTIQSSSDIHWDPLSVQASLNGLIDNPGYSSFESLESSQSHRTLSEFTSRQGPKWRQPLLEAVSHIHARVASSPHSGSGPRSVALSGGREEQACEFSGNDEVFGQDKCDGSLFSKAAGGREGGSGMKWGSTFTNENDLRMIRHPSWSSVAGQVGPFGQQSFPWPPPPLLREHDLHELGTDLNQQPTYFKRRRDSDHLRSRTMPGRGGSVREVVAAGLDAPILLRSSRSGLSGQSERPPIGRPRSVNSSFDTRRAPHNQLHQHHSGLPSSAQSSLDQTGYMSDRNDLARFPQSRGGGLMNGTGYMNQRNLRLAPMGGSSRQDSIRSGYVSDHEALSSSQPHMHGLNASMHQSSLDGAHIQNQDARLCYLTSSEISDDDRMSLTTAQSDEDDIESSHNSPYKAKQSGSAASFNCTGAVRKAGFLSVKKWILRKKHQVELARKRGWKGYWVCLKGTTLLFYPCDSREGRSVEATPKHLIIVDGAIMQAIPEHPKRDYIFCLSTAFGDAYLFQAPCQVELENWVNSIHSACAAAFARHRGKTGTLHLLQEEIYRLEKNIESDQKLKHMAELQLSVVSDTSSKLQIEGQITQWEENLERLHCEQFRLRCYMASLQNGELPNPKGVLTQVTSSTKQTLNRLGVFTVSSFHAYICARSPSLLNNLLAGRGATKRRAPLLSRSNSASSRRSLTSTMNAQGGGGTNGVATVVSPGEGHDSKLVKVTLPDGQIVTFYLRDAMTVEDFLGAACVKKGLQPVEHFVRVKKRRDMPNMKYFVPHRSDLIETYLQTHEVVEVCAKILYQVELNRGNLDIMWGFSVEAELVENSDKQDELCCYVSRVEERSVAMNNGIIKGDEIMVINGAIVSDLDMMFLESVLQEEIALCMMMRSSRTEPPDPANALKSTDDMIDSLVCPPPPSDNPLNEEAISSLIVPAPEWSKDQAVSPEGDSTAPPSQASERSDVPPTLVTSASRRIAPIQPQSKIPAKEPRGRGGGTGAIVGDQPPLDVDALLNKSGRGPKDSPGSDPPMTPTRTLSDTEKLRKVICELVDTEHTYVRHLGFLMNTYLEPLKDEGFLSSSEISSLFGNIQEIYTFQQQFLRTLEEAIEVEPQFHQLDSPPQFKSVLFSIANAFLYYVNHFKLYSSFCASHSKAQKALHPNEGNQALQEFLHSLNPRQQHSTALESYLIKPIQRILKYPLLLQQLKSLSPPESDEQQHLIEALIGMEKVAEHINEMQRIHEEYGAIFDHLFRQHQKASKQTIDLSPGDLLYYGGVEWLNIADFLGKIKKGLELHAMCFVFKTAVVFLCKERLRQKKKSLIGTSSKSNQAEVEIIRYQVLIPVSEVQVRASSVKDVESHYLWELIHLKSSLQRRSEKVYHLSNSTAEFRNAFLKTIRQIIRESVRNMNLPHGMSMMTSSSTSPPSGSPNHNLHSKPEPPQRSQSTRLTGQAGGGPLESPQHGNTHTLQLSRKRATPKQPFNSLQRHSSNPSGGGSIPDYDNVENCRFDSGPNDESSVGGEESDGQPAPSARRPPHHGAHHRRQGSSGNGQVRSRSHTGDDDLEYGGGSIVGPGGSVSETESLTRGDKSEFDEGSERSARRRSHQLGTTPSHLTLSNTSTLSTLSTASSQQRAHIAPPQGGSGKEDRRSSSNGLSSRRPTGSSSRSFETGPVPPPPPHATGSASDLGSPVWKPRHNGGPATRGYGPSRRPNSDYGSTSSHESLQSASQLLDSLIDELRAY